MSGYLKPYPPILTGKQRYSSKAVSAGEFELSASQRAALSALAAPRMPSALSQKDAIRSFDVTGGRPSKPSPYGRNAYVPHHSMPNRTRSTNDMRSAIWAKVISGEVT